MEKNLFQKYVERCEDPKTYLNRIGIKTIIDINLTSLNLLIDSHHKNVPFENVGIYDYGYHVDLHEDALFEKIVMQKKGGYCFENNAVFASLLNSIGFDVRACACRVTRDQNKINAIRHRANIVRINDKDYFCDVGFGGYEYPLALEICEGKRVRCGNTEFYFARYDNDWWELHAISTFNPEIGEFDEPKDSVYIMVGTYNVIPEDFYTISEYCCTSAESSFTKQRRVYIQTETGMVSLVDNKLTIIDNLDVQVRNVDSCDIYSVLKEYFGIVY